MCKYFVFVFIILFVTAVQAQSLKQTFPKSFTLEITNPLPTPREQVMVLVPAEQIKPIKDFNAEGFVVLDGEKEIPSQYKRQDGHASGIVFVLDKLASSARKKVQVRYHPTASVQRQYPKRTQAELSHKTGGKWVNREYLGGEFKNVRYLRVPPEHKDHSWFLRYEGPGWESDKVGYRFYLDQRNATDVFGKKTPAMILQQVGQDGFDSYHEMQPWGMDVMKVGPSLGIGSIGVVENGKAMRVEKTDSVTCEIKENGVVYSSIETHYYGWQHAANKIDLRSTLSIHAGTHLTHQLLTITGNADHLCTGIGRERNILPILEKGDASRFGYLATYGKQSLNGDALGLAVFFDPRDWLAFTQDAHSHIVTLRPDQGKVSYYFMGTWALEPGGILDEDQFLLELDRIATELANPVTVKVTRK